MPTDSSAWAIATRSAGDVFMVRAAPSWLMVQFWQNMQCRLQPGAATERMGRPGWKWYSGFFSMGSTAAETMRP